MPEITDDLPQTPRIATEDEVVRRHFLATCVACRWQLSAIAKALGLSLKTVYNRRDRYERQGWIEPQPKGWRLRNKESG